MKSKRATPARSRPSDLTLVAVSCPDCAGVLSVKQEGQRQGLQRLYVCQINHRHSTTSLYQAMEERLENTLWTAVVILKQLDSLYDELLAEHVRPSESGNKHIKRRLREVRDQRAAIRALIEGTHVIEATS
jgi:hypothetical protein